MSSILEAILMSAAKDAMSGRRREPMTLSLADLLAGSGSGGAGGAPGAGPSIFEAIFPASGEKDGAADLSKDEQIAKLKEFGAEYAEGCPFEVGDLVTPRRGSGVKWRGRPWRVVETRAPSAAEWTPFSGEGDAREGARQDLRVAVVVPSGGIVCFWNESHKFETWKPPSKAAPDADANRPEPSADKVAAEV